MRRRGRRSFRKRRTFRKRMRKSSQYGMHMSWKCEASGVLTQEADSATADCTINWLTLNNPVTTGIYVKPTDSSEFVSFISIFRYYRIVGMRIRYQPIGNITSLTGSYVRTG